MCLWVGFVLCQVFEFVLCEWGEGVDDFLGVGFVCDCVVGVVYFGFECVVYVGVYGVWDDEVVDCDWLCLSDAVDSCYGLLVVGGCPWGFYYEHVVGCVEGVSVCCGCDADGDVLVVGVGVEFVFVGFGLLGVLSADDFESSGFVCDGLYYVAVVGGYDDFVSLFVGVVDPFYCLL